ncbi:uncharacterized protein LOC130812809 [Amaranthus tricolor]|uniref:uncharacterized protein LOC130812809 n=1 Tax=Amaranthus tricolor TaxID=29722 RepID=UPI002585D4BB|nr:uncharacterized protein LOC130812809 [Amaranthus tricolor]
MTVPWELYREIHKLDLEIVHQYQVVEYLGEMTIQPTLFERIIEAQEEDPGIIELIILVQRKETEAFEVSDKGALRMNGRLCIPDNTKLKEEILKEGHQGMFHLHPGRGKMIEDLRKLFWWKVGLPRTQQGNDTIWVIVDRLTNLARFLRMKGTWSVKKLAEAYVREILRLHGVTRTIVSDRDPKFLSRFWENLKEAFGSKLCLSTAFHPILHTTTTIKPTSRWHPNEALYGRKCRVPLCWDQMDRNVPEGPDLIQDSIELEGSAREHEGNTK